MSAQAQQQTPAGASTFTAGDMLDLGSLRIADLSEDGRWLAVARATQHDGIDNYRIGDPTYIAPSLSDVWIIDLQDSRSRKLLPAKSQVQSLNWYDSHLKGDLSKKKGEPTENR